MAGDLVELIDRVRNATGPDREADVAIDDLFEVKTIPFAYDPHSWVAKTDTGYLPTTRHQNSIAITGDRYVPRYTASIDAIVELIEAKLPGGDWTRRTENQVIICEVWWTDGELKFEEASATTTCLALCLAFLIAIQSQHSEAKDDTL